MCSSPAYLLGDLIGLCYTRVGEYFVLEGASSHIMDSSVPSELSVVPFELLIMREKKWGKNTL